MSINNLFTRILYIGFFINCLISNLTHAAAPLWTYSAPKPANVTVSNEQTVAVNYIITNQSLKSKNLILQPIPGVSASSCYLATKGSTCTMTLTIDGSKLVEQSILNPVLCDRASVNQCYQPTAVNQVRINRTPTPSETTGHLALSQFGNSITVLNILAGDSATLNLTNTGTGALTGLTVILPSGWESYFTNNCTSDLAPQQSCSITYTVPELVVAGLFNPLFIKATHSDNVLNIPVTLHSLGAAKCWGENTYGQLATGNTTTQYVPAATINLSDVIDITGGSLHGCAVRKDNSTWCWGRNNDGQLGNGNNSDSSIPVLVSTLNNVLKVIAGTNHSCALKSDQTAWCWGNNSHGQLGNESTSNSNTPVSVNSLNKIIALTGGAMHSCAITAAHAAWCWGDNTYGQLGNGTTTSSFVPVAVNITGAVSAIAAGGAQTCALRVDGTVWCWGQNNNGQLGNGTNINSPIPVQVSNLTDVIAINGGLFHNCALKQDKTVWCWGGNAFGQLGNNTNTSSNVPVQVSNLTDVLAFTGGSLHNCALANDQSIWCWGYNGSGQLGNSTVTDGIVPVRTCAASGCPLELEALAVMNHGLGNQSCALVP